MAAKKTATKTAKAEAPAPTAKKAAKKAPAAKKASEKAPAAKKAPAPAKPTVSPDAIARAAYLNYRSRVEQGLPGDSHGDWLAAERQLLP